MERNGVEAENSPVLDWFENACRSFIRCSSKAGQAYPALLADIGARASRPHSITQAQWEAVMGENPSKFKGRSNPVENVSWDDIQVFIKRLNQKEGTNKYRLPTEAEWEYAARAGTTSAYSFGDDADSLGRYAWYDGNSGDKTHPVGQKQPNPWGLHDMHGNIKEWVQDWYDQDYYAKSPARDPRGPSGGLFRVLRGGGWIDDAEDLRSAYRDSIFPNIRHYGFRLAFSLGHP
jgi:formylglycine-generating enzyme required for sulfatase activity